MQSEEYLHSSVTFKVFMFLTDGNKNVNRNIWKQSNEQAVTHFQCVC